MNHRNFADPETFRGQNLGGGKCDLTLVTADTSMRA